MANQILKGLILALLAGLGSGAHAWEVDRVYSKSEKECLALNIYHEARGEDLEGQVAVGMTTINRVLSKKFPNTICGVVKQTKVTSKKKYRLCQFSWYCDYASDVPNNKDAWEDAQIVAEALLHKESAVGDITGSSLYYTRCDIRPVWTRSLKPTRKIGDHCFYTYPGYEEIRTLTHLSPNYLAYLKAQGVVAELNESDATPLAPLPFALVEADVMGYSPDGTPIYYSYSQIGAIKAP